MSLKHTNGVVADVMDVDVDVVEGRVVVSVDVCVVLVGVVVVSVDVCVVLVGVVLVGVDV